jgi:hypothetical protein
MASERTSLALQSGAVMAAGHACFALTFPRLPNHPSPVTLIGVTVKNASRVIQGVYFSESDEDRGAFTGSM